MNLKRNLRRSRSSMDHHDETPTLAIPRFLPSCSIEVSSASSSTPRAIESESPPPLAVCATRLITLRARIARRHPLPASEEERRREMRLPPCRRMRFKQRNGRSPPALLHRSVCLFSSNAIPYASIRNPPPFSRSTISPSPSPSLCTLSLSLSLSLEPRSPELSSSCPPPASSLRSPSRLTPMSIFPYRLIRKERQPSRRPARFSFISLFPSIRFFLYTTSQPGRLPLLSPATTLPPHPEPGSRRCFSAFHPKPLRLRLLLRLHSTQAISRHRLQPRTCGIKLVYDLMFSIVARRITRVTR